MKKVEWSQLSDSVSKAFMKHNGWKPLREIYDMEPWLNDEDLVKGFIFNDDKKYTLFLLMWA